MTTGSTYILNVDVFMQLCVCGIWHACVRVDCICKYLSNTSVFVILIVLEYRNVVYLYL